MVSDALAHCIVAAMAVPCGNAACGLHRGDAARQEAAPTDTTDLGAASPAVTIPIPLSRVQPSFSYLASSKTRRGWRWGKRTSGCATPLHRTPSAPRLRCVSKRFLRRDECDDTALGSALDIASRAALSLYTALFTSPVSLTHDISDLGLPPVILGPPSESRIR